MLFTRKLLSVGMICFTLFLSSASTVIVNADDTVRIGAWNIEWLGFQARRSSFGKDTPQKPEDIANYIHETGVSVLALEEIGVDTQKKPYKCSELEAALKVLESKYQQKWDYVLFPKTDYPADMDSITVRAQHVGLAWNSDVAKLVGEPFALPIDPNETYGIKFLERRANAAKLSFGEGKTDVVFIPVHLKSNRNDAKPDDKDFTRKQRMAEVGEIVKKLPTLKTHFKDEDVVILGDTNFLATEDSTPELLIESGFVDLNAIDLGTTVTWGKGYSSAPFDRIFTPKEQTEFKSAKLTVHKPDDVEKIKDFRRQLSDHYMVTFDLNISSDDD